MPATALREDRVDNAELERGAFNAAFYELGLRLYWDTRTYQALASNPSERDRVRTYLERERPHLLRAYDADFLTDAVLSAKRRCRQAQTATAAARLSEPSCSERPWEEVGF